ncbi:MAG: hypothetical protein ABEH56_07120 [Salinirussus sp.]
MIDRLGVAGIVGVLLLFGGIGLIAWHSLIAGGGVALIVAGIGLVVYGMVTNLLSSMGMGGLV